jgi:hypothetical protein
MSSQVFGVCVCVCLCVSQVWLKEEVRSKKSVPGERRSKSMPPAGGPRSPFYLIREACYMNGGSKREE